MNSNLFHTNSGLILAFAFGMPGFLVLLGSWACSVCVRVCVCVCVCVCVWAHTHTQLLSGVQLFATPWTVACQAPLFLGFFRPEYWSGLPFPTPGTYQEHTWVCSPPRYQTHVSPTLAGRFLTTSTTWKACLCPYRALMHFLLLPELFAKGIFSDTITSQDPLSQTVRELFFLNFSFSALLTFSLNTQ